MFVTLFLAAAAALGAPAPEAAPPAAAPRAPVERMRGPLPSGSTQPLTTTPRPSIGFLSAESLRDRCESNAAGLVSYCFAYITGVHDTVQAYETWLRVREFCPPYTSSQADMRRAFLTYLKGNPDAASAEAASVIVLAFKDQFACSEPGAAKQAAPASRPASKPAAKR
jgi:hypothetical protein